MTGQLRTRLRASDLIKFSAVVLACLWLVVRGGVEIGYNWHWQTIPGYFGHLEQGRFVAGPLLAGLAVTLEITFLSLLLAAAIGLLTAVLRLSPSPVGRFLARIYLEVIRNTPLLVQIFFLYFVMAPILDIGRFATAVLALSIFEGAYASEIFRAGIQGVDRGQWEAGHALGLKRVQIYRFVILPQAVRQVLPPLTSQAVSLLKDSALVSTIAVYDLTMQARTIIAETFLTFEIWSSVALIYLVFALALSWLADRTRQRLVPAGE